MTNNQNLTQTSTSILGSRLGGVGDLRRQLRRWKRENLRVRLTPTIWRRKGKGCLYRFPVPPGSYSRIRTPQHATARKMKKGEKKKKKKKKRAE